MPNKVIFYDDENVELNRADLVQWYIDFDPYGIYNYDRIKYDAEMTTIQELAQIYSEFEEKDRWEIIKDPEDKDILDEFLREIKRLWEDIVCVTKKEEVVNFLKELEETAQLI